MDDAALIESRRGELLAVAREAQGRAYAPYSQYAVGASVLTRDGFIFGGCNVENSSFGLTICAERSAVFGAVSDGHRDILAVLVVTSGETIGKPCGACRQVLAEFSDASRPLVVISVGASGESVSETIIDLLPGAFHL